MPTTTTPIKILTELERLIDVNNFDLDEKGHQQRIEALIDSMISELPNRLETHDNRDLVYANVLFACRFGTIEQLLKTKIAVKQWIETSGRDTELEAHIRVYLQTYRPHRNFFGGDPERPTFWAGPFRTWLVTNERHLVFGRWDPDVLIFLEEDEHMMDHRVPIICLHAREAQGVTSAR